MPECREYNNINDNNDDDNGNDDTNSNNNVCFTAEAWTSLWEIVSVTHCQSSLTLFV